VREVMAPRSPPEISFVRPRSTNAAYTSLLRAWVAGGEVIAAQEGGIAKRRVHHHHVVAFAADGR